MSDTNVTTMIDQKALRARVQAAVLLYNRACTRLFEAEKALNAVLKHIDPDGPDATLIRDAIGPLGDAGYMIMEAEDTLSEADYRFGRVTQCSRDHIA